MEAAVSLGDASMGFAIPLPAERGGKACGVCFPSFDSDWEVRLDVGADPFRFPLPPAVGTFDPRGLAVLPEPDSPRFLVCDEDVEVLIVGFTIGLALARFARASAVVLRFFLGMLFVGFVTGLAPGIPRPLPLPFICVGPWKGDNCIAIIPSCECIWGCKAGEVNGEKRSALVAVLPTLENTLAGVIAGDSSGVNEPGIIFESVILRPGSIIGCI